MAVDPGSALARVGLDPSACTVDDLAHNRWLTAGIWLVSAPGRRFVLKCLASRQEHGRDTWGSHWAAGADDAHRWNYWAREGLAYEFGIPDAYAPAGIVAPRVVASDRDATTMVLLLEFVDGEPAERWDIADYASAAAALGRAQAPFLIEPHRVRQPWLSRRFLREYSSEKPVDWSLLDDDRAWDQPLIRRNFPSELREAARRLHGSRDHLCTIAERLPRTLCHLDFWTKNLIRRTDGTIVLLDWAFVGDGAVGEDIGNLVPDAAFDHFVPAAALPELGAAVLAAYTEGLTDAGWDGDRRLVELGMCASAVKYDWLTPFMLASAATDRQLRYGGTEEIDADHRFRERGLALLHNARLAGRAELLAADLAV